MGYARSPVRDFESYLTIALGFDEDDIQLILKQNKSNFVTYQLFPVVYTIKDNVKSVYTMGDQKGTLKIQFDDISMKTKLVLTRFSGNFRTLRFNEKFFFLKLYWVLHLFGIKNLPMQLMLIALVYILGIKF